MLDFTSVLYLGIRHAHHTLRPWPQLTTGRPSTLEPAPEAIGVAQDLARLLRCERAVLAPSTLHLYWDLFDVLANEHIAIYADAGRLTRLLAGAYSARPPSAELDSAGRKKFPANTARDVVWRVRIRIRRQGSGGRI